MHLLVAPASLAAAAGASFVTAFVASPHCALMCGPLACAGFDAGPGARARVALAWHAGRLIAYAIIGALLGGVGAAALTWLHAPAARALPYVMAAALVFSALELGRRLPPLPGLRRIPGALARLAAPLPRLSRAALRGAATPFLPCGLLYGGFLIAAASGSAPAGAAILAAFALGAIPALAVAQANVHWLTGRARAARILRVSVPLLAAALLIWRATTTGAPSPDHPPACPAHAIT